jgi:hypothetical protein
MNDYTPQTFAQAILTRLGYPVTKLNVSDIMSWEAAEGGHWNNDAKYNPLNTTQVMPGDSTINSVGVKAYTSWSQGINATLKTLNNGRYGLILEALRNGGTQDFGTTVAGTSWGTSAFNVSVHPKGIVGVTASTIDITQYPGLSVHNGVYHITYSASTGAKMANFMGQNSAISAIETWNNSSKVEAKKHGVGSSTYIGWVEQTLPDIYGANSATSTSGGSSGATSDLTDISGLLGLSGVTWWEILIVIFAGVAVLLILYKSLNVQKMIPSVVPVPV